MIKQTLPLILASGSPRRKEILDMMGLAYTVDVSEADETFCGEPAETVLELSKRKALAVAPRHENALILAADTLVFGENVLGKPGTRENAEKMLRSLSDCWHCVYTGMTLIDTAAGKVYQKADCTRVHFVKMTESEIQAYAASDEPLDKAGAYAIQGIGGMFVDRIEGSYSNVVGLSMTALRDLLHEAGQV